MNNEIKKTTKELFSSSFYCLKDNTLKINTEIANDLIKKHGWLTVYEYWYRYLINNCKDEKSILNFINLFFAYCNGNYNIYNPKQFIGYLYTMISKEHSELEILDMLTNKIFYSSGLKTQKDLCNYIPINDPIVISSVKEWREKLKVNYEELSKEISYALRHNPWEYNLELDERGYTSINQLLNAINTRNKYPRIIVREDIEYIIKHSNKQRHEILNDKIRALYGHSSMVKIIKDEKTPPEILYHGTANKFLCSIMNEGLKPQSRQYVHLSKDLETAISVGKRRDNNPIILEIDAKTAFEDGLKFYVGDDKIWLCDYIPVKYIKIIKEKIN